MKEYAEIRCDYNNDEGFWCVDAWKTTRNGEVGKVVAVVSDKTGDVYYVDPDARYSPKVIEAVKELRKRVEATMPLLRVATLIEVGHESGQTFIQTFVAADPKVLAEQVDNALRVEAKNSKMEIAWDYVDILSECMNGNQNSTGEPLSIEIVGEDCSHEFLLSTKVIPAYLPEPKKRSHVLPDKDVVTVVCYGKNENLPRLTALKRYFTFFASSEGSEHERYENVIMQLLMGRKQADDTKDWRVFKDAE